MSSPCNPDVELEKRIADRLLDVLVRVGLVFAMAMLCFRIFSPFLSLMVWALILAVTLYPLHRKFAAMLGGKRGLAATLIVVLGLVLIVAPTAVLTNSLGDSVQHLAHDVQNNSLQIPAPRPGTNDNALTPPLLGRGVDAPMPVILLGALGGMAAAGILGRFVGATRLALGYQIFMGWVAANPDKRAESAPVDSQPIA